MTANAAEYFRFALQDFCLVIVGGDYPQPVDFGCDAVEVHVVRFDVEVSGKRYHGFRYIDGGDAGYVLAFFEECFGFGYDSGKADEKEDG